MLIEFRVENHRSLRDEQVLTMQAARGGEGADPRPRRVPGTSELLIPVAALYGGNASGKSNVLAALAFMRDAVMLSHRAWAPDEGVPRDPFAWGPKRGEPSTFEVTFRQDATRFQYGFVASDACFLEEWLYAWPHGKKQVWFERDGQEFQFKENLRGENRVIEGLTRANSLFLSAAAQNKHPQLTGIFTWFRDVMPINVRRERRRFGGFPSDYRAAIARAADANRANGLLDYLFGGGELDDRLLPRLLTLLKKADIGIVDIRVSSKETSEEPPRVAQRLIQLKHLSNHGDAWLPIQEESHGTQALFLLVYPILNTLDLGAVLLVDELEASLHPRMCQEIVRLFNDPATNPRNAQLLFTTHDTNLLGTTLGEPALRRDQVWLTEKDKEGATVLYPLTDYKPRKAENMERGYLQGRYGAIPFLGEFNLVGKRQVSIKE
jgi:uncharacterized protein